MKKIFYFFSLVILLSSQITAQNSLLEALHLLPDVIVLKTIETPDTYKEAYELRIKQALDHKHPEKGHFFQKVYLSHLDINRPVVLVTEGYTRSANRMYELTKFINANQIIVEHRFFGESKPDPYDWQYLNLEQVTADLHKVNQLFRQIYQGKWLSTGISKGGQTTIAYRYFYPEDVDVSVPYVAPLDNSIEDPRIYSFLEKVGTEACRNDIKAVQRRLLKERKKILPLLKWHAKGTGYTFNYMSLEEAFEYAVLEYSFSFWQMGFKCENIPGPEATLEELLDDFIAVVGLWLFSDQGVKDLEPHYYQAATEMGYYGFETDDFDGLIKYLPENPNAAFTPKNVKISFDPSLCHATAAWVEDHGNNFIYIYGETDTWSATAVPPL